MINITQKMIRLGKFDIGFGPLSMAIIFVLLSIFAISSAFSQAKPEFPMPLSSLMIINETMAVLATLVYGICVHLIVAFLNWYKRRNGLKNGNGY